MKEFDRVELIKDRTEYSKNGVYVHDRGTILDEKTRHGYVLVYFDGDIFVDENGCYQTTEIDLAVKAEDLRVLTDDEIERENDKMV